MDKSITTHIPEMTTEEAQSLAQQWSPKQWAHEIAKLTPGQLASVIPLASPKLDPILWKEKLDAAISGLKEHSQLEALGKVLTVTQSIEILSYVNKQQYVADKLAPILVGMTQTVFYQLLTNLPANALAPLKQDALTEAVQHHLTLLVQNLEGETTAYQNALLQKERELEALGLDHLQKDIASIESSIEQLQQQGFVFLQLTSAALSVAWNTMRTDLIENLSRIKEQCQRIVNFNEGPTGLKASFEKKLNSIFAEFGSDEIPSTEAMVKFGVWYLRDYWEIGLLPHLNEHQLENGKTPAEAQAFREKLFIQVNQNLKKIGLSTLADLKRAKIYSKSALKVFIESSMR